MYAVIQDRTKQYRVQAGDRVRIDYRKGAKPGSEIVFEDVLFVGDDAKKTAAGAPKLSSAKVLGKIAEAEEKGDKVHVVQWKRRKQYQRHVGHRQKYTVVTITEIKV